MPFRRRPPPPPPPPPPPDEAETVVKGRPIPPEPPLGGPPPEPDRELWPWLVVLLVLLAIGGGLAAYFATRGGGGHKTQQVTVPGVVGFNESAAVSVVKQRGLDPNVSRTFSDKTSGDVISQDPAGGKTVDKGTVVGLVVSRGPSSVTVPNVVSLTEANAVAQLTNAGLNGEVVQVPSTVASGKVVAQNPTGGTKVAPGSRVRLNVSKGRTQTTTVTTTSQTTTVVTTGTTSASTTTITTSTTP
jgi:eukaryotic-like serine/threonine-protein kinase